MANIPIKKKSEIEKEKEIKKLESDLKQLEEQFEGLNDSANKLRNRQEEVPQELVDALNQTLTDIKGVEDELETLS